MEVAAKLNMEHENIKASYTSRDQDYKQALANAFSICYQVSLSFM
jgi:hypothetical protein